MNIIDELVVKFKIDSSQAKKQADESAKTVQTVKRNVKISAEDQERIARSQEQSAREREARQEKRRKEQAAAEKKRLRERERQAEEYGDKIKGVAKSIAGAFLGFETLKGAINLFNNITTATAALGRKSENLGVAAQDLQTWELAVKKAGGEAADADSAFATLSQTFTGALLQGKDSPFLQLLNSMGVAARDAKQQIRPLGDVLTELADHMQARGLSRANAFNLFTAAGGNEGVFNLLYDKRRSAFLTESRTAANANAQKISDSQKFQESRAKIKENIGAVLSDIQGAIVHEAVSGAALTGFKKGSKAERELNRRKYLPSIQETERKYNLPAGQLEKLIDQESHFDPTAKSKKGAVGIAQLLPKYHPNAGKDPYADIDESGKELARLRDAYHGDLGLAIAAYNTGQGNVGKVLRGEMALPAETANYTKQVYGATPAVLTGAGGAVNNEGADHSVTVTTGPVTVVTQATDANGIARDFAGAMRDKGALVSQSNYGVTP